MQADHSAPREDPQALIRVGDLLIDFSRYTVSRDGRDLALPRLSFDLLAALVRAAPGLLTHDELMSRVWPGLVVSPETLAQRVKLLRTALGDDPASPRYIAVVRGRGYFVLAPVAPDAAPAAPAMASPVATSVPAPASRMWRRGAALIAALVAAGVVLWLGLRPPGPAEQGPKTVAVLPFETLSGTADDAYLGLGVADQVLERLATVESLTVLARGPSPLVVERGTDLRDLGRQLGATLLVRGTVQRVGDRLRITVQVVDSRDGRQIGTLRADGTLEGLFTLQDEVAAGVSRLLNVSTAATHTGTEDVRAWLEYLQGIEAANRWRLAEVEAAQRHFRRARELDQGFAAPYAAEALSYSALASLRVEPLSAYRAQAQALAERALELDPSLGAGHAALAAFASDPRETLAHAERAVQLAPADSDAHVALGNALAQFPERLGQALTTLEHAIRIDPMRAGPRYDLAMSRFMEEGDLEALAGRLVEVLQVDPSFTRALTRLATIRGWRQGRFADGVLLIERGREADPDSEFARERAVDLYLAIGDRAGALAALSPRGREDPTVVALSYLLDERAAPVPPTGAALIPPGHVFRTLEGGLTEIAVALALRDSALLGGDARRVLAAARDFRCSSNQQALPCDPARSPALAAAQAELHLATGQRAAGEHLLATARQSLEQRDKPFFTAYGAYVLARIHLIEGRPMEALATIEHNHRDRGFFGLWLVLERDALFAALREDPRLRLIIDASRRHAESERQKLARMRAAAP